MRGLFIRVVLALLTVAVITATPGWRHAMAVQNETSAHSLGCAHMRTLPGPDAPPFNQADDDACCAVCQMDADGDAIILAPTAPVARVRRGYALISSVTSVVRLRSQATGPANYARAPPRLS
jgi:hypothetical protein